MRSGTVLGATASSSGQGLHVWAEVKGMDQLLDRLEDLYGDVTDEAVQAVYDEAEAIMAMSQGIVPVDTGFLRDSKYIGQLKRGPSFFVQLGYDASYAVPVHEIPPPPAVSVGGRSATHTNGRWKYLEQPVLARQGGMAKRIATRIRYALGRR